MKGQSLLQSALMGENKGNGVNACLIQRELRHRRAGLFLFWFWFEFFLFMPGQIFNKLFILISIFDAFTITISSFHQQLSLALNNLSKLSEEVAGRAGN